MQYKHFGGSSFRRGSSDACCEKREAHDDLLANNLNVEIHL